MKLLLVGSPNAGKSTLYNALTGGRARVGNWHGVTVGVLEGIAKIGKNTYEVCDLPGIYSANTYSMEEGIAQDYLSNNRDACILFLSECATLPRALPYLKALKRGGRRICLVLTKKRAFERHGGRVNADYLSEYLSLPVFCVEGNEKKSVACLRSRLALFLEAPMSEIKEKEATHVGDSVTLPPSAYRAEDTCVSVADKILFHGGACLALFFLMLAATFYVTFAPNCLGDILKNFISDFFSKTLASLAEGIHFPIVRGLVVDGVLKGLGSVLCFLPQIAILYLVLILLEESGLMSRLAIHTDGVLSAVGLNGRAVFSLLMGFGCTAAAILTTRGLEDKRMQRRAILTLPYLSCSAKLPVFLTLSASFFENPFVAVLFLYALGVGIAFCAALLLSPKDTPPFLLEIAPLQIPNWKFTFKSLLFQLKQFIIKTATVILAFFILSWMLSSFDFTFRYCAVEESMLAVVCGWLKYLFAPVGCADWKVAYAMLSGLIAKENVAGALAMFYGAFPFSAGSAFALSVFVLTCSPCVSAITATAREVGAKRAILYAFAQTGSALIASYVAYFAVCGGWIYLCCGFALVCAILIVKKGTHEKIRRTRRNRAKRIYR